MPVCLLVERRGTRAAVLGAARVRVCVLPVGPRQDAAARRLADALLAAALRSRLELDGSLGARVRHARRRRDHLIAVVGEAEAAAGAARVTDVAAGFEGLVSGPDLIRLAGGARAARQRHVSWPG